MTEALFYYYYMAAAAAPADPGGYVAPGGATPKVFGRRDRVLAPVNHYPTLVTVTTSTGPVWGQGIGNPAGTPRSSLTLRNNSGTVTVLLRWGSLAAPAYTLGPGQEVTDYTQSPVYADVASGTAVLYVDPIY